eukprot:maker-scaffold1136_size60149-snap-gene-0.9 protein:Tk09876 transcript:maker-scaffold1136_size60149-snap-gene-0.9-mRNA-1 annotation:"prostaglandin e synthase 2"
MLALPTLRLGAGSLRPSLSAQCQKTFLVPTLGASAPSLRQFFFKSKAGGGQPKRGSFLLQTIVGGAVVGTGYAMYQNYGFWNQGPQKQIANPQNSLEDYLMKEELPEFKVARKMINPLDHSGLKLTLFQYQPCPFCCKTRAMLDYYGLNYDVIEVNSVTKKQVKWSDYKKVPILVVESPNGQKIKLTDSTMIISAIASFLTDKSQSLQEVASCFPRIAFTDDAGKEKMDIMNKYFLMFKEAPTNRTKEDIVNERKWRRWVDDELIHKLSPNVYRTPSEALQAFEWFDKMGDWKEHFSSWERFLVIYFGAFIMWVIGKRLKARHNLKQDVRTSLYDDCNHWVRNVKKRGKTFMGGDQPNLADLGVYGALSAIEGCGAFDDLMAKSNIGPWFQATKEAIQNHQGQYLLEGR